MTRNRITRGGGARRALLTAVAVGLAAVALAACGGGEGEPTEATGPSTAAEREADVAVLTPVLSRQLGVVAAYRRAMSGLRGFDLASARLFHAQEQEHVDAIVKTLKGLGAPAQAQAEEIDVSQLKSRTDHVEFLYEMESATIDAELSAISKLNTSWTRSLLASIVANQAQHLALLRRELGAKPLATVPTPFENGATPAP